MLSTSIRWWRALGPKIENEFDTLDDRYVRLNATSVVDLYRLRGPNAAGTGLSSFKIVVMVNIGYTNTLAEDNAGWAASVQTFKIVLAQIGAIPDVNLDGYATGYVDRTIKNRPGTLPALCKGRIKLFLI